MLEHDYEWVYNNDAACEKNGTETGTCKDCGAVYTREKAGTALGHQPGGWIVDKEATTAADGNKHKKCTVCGQVLERAAIPATGTAEQEPQEPQGTKPPADSGKENPAAVRSPQTGDNADVVLWALLLVLSVLMMAFAVQIRKQKHI